MTGHDVFLSYSFNDQPIADGVCETLEANAIRCWLVSRDNIAGVPYGEGIIEALNQSRVMLLILTSHSNVSDQVHREVERAASKKIAIVAIRLEDIVLSKTMEYFLSNIHWLDALSGWPDEAVLPRLVKDLRRRLPPPRKQRGARRGEKKSRSPAPQQVAIAAEAGVRGGERGRGAEPLHGGLAPRPADAPGRPPASGILTTSRRSRRGRCSRGGMMRSNSSWMPSTAGPIPPSSGSSGWARPPSSRRSSRTG